MHQDRWKLVVIFMDLHKNNAAKIFNVTTVSIQHKLFRSVFIIAFYLYIAIWRWIMAESSSSKKTLRNCDIFLFLHLTHQKWLQMPGFLLKP